jgi:hypothetical protein
MHLRVEWSPDPTLIAEQDSQFHVARLFDGIKGHHRRVSGSYLTDHASSPK